MVIADLPGADLILCQITSRAHWDAFAVPLDRTDFERGQLPEPGFILRTLHRRTTHHSSLSRNEAMG